MGPLDYQLFANIVPSTTKKYSKNIFDTLKPFLAEAIYQTVMRKKKGNKGPKPKRHNISASLDALFEAMDSGTKVDYLERHHKIPRATYYRYLKIISNNGLLEIFREGLTSGFQSPSLSLVDASHIRSVDGSEAVAYGYKENSKKALKITLLTGANKVIYLKGVHPDNLTDHTAFQQVAINCPSNAPIEVLADSGYNGRAFKDICQENGYHIISCVKKWRTGASHKLSNYQKLLIKRTRSRVEHVFAQLKRFRGVQVKNNKTIWAFNCYLDLAILLVSIHNGIIRKGLRQKVKIALKK